MNTCKNCRYWGVDYAPDKDGSNVCDYVNTKNSGTGSKKFEIVSWAHDDSGLEVKLLTGPDFGCVNHTSKVKRRNV